MAAKATRLGKAPRLGGLLLAGLAFMSAHAQGVTGPLPFKMRGAIGAPTISGSPVRVVLAGSFYDFQPTASDPNGDRLAFSIESLPGWANFDPGTGRLYGTPTPSDIGRTRGIRISVSDGTSTRSLGRFGIKVAGGTAPRISGLPALTAAVGQPYRFQPSATDDDRQKLKFRIVNRPAWARFDRSSGRLTGTPPKGSVGTYANIGISVTDGASTSRLPPFTISVTNTKTNPSTSPSPSPRPNPSPSPNSTTATTTTATTAAPPKISGTPATVAAVGQAYSFVPAASSSGGQTLAFGIANKPGWASFDITTGRLSGTPSSVHVGSYPNIVISLSDGKLSATLPPFTITVKAQVVGSADLYWSTPTLNEDGSALTNLAGYRIRYGTSPGTLDKVVNVASPAVTSAVIEGLAAGTWYFSIASYTNTGVESAAVGPVYRTIE